jgi:hypothetical protein
MTKMYSPDLQLDALKDVQTAVRDAINGYEAMREKAEPSFKPLVEHILDVHKRHDADLVRILAGDPSTNDTSGNSSGSWMSTVHQTVVTVRSWFDDIDHGLIPEVIDGEERLVATYNNALSIDQSAWPKHVLELQRSELNTLITDLRKRAA